MTILFLGFFNNIDIAMNVAIVEDKLESLTPDRSVYNYKLIYY